MEQERYDEFIAVMRHQVTCTLAAFLVFIYQAAITC